MLQWLPILVSAAALSISAILGVVAGRDRRMTTQLNRERNLMDWINAVRESYVSLVVGRLGDHGETDEQLVTLSALIDQGRIYFPNDDANLRSRVLDPLVELHRRFERREFDPKKAKADWRQFTDQIGLHTTAFRVRTSPEATGQPQYRNP